MKGTPGDPQKVELEGIECRENRAMQLGEGEFLALTKVFQTGPGRILHAECWLEV
jgi:hypothetical protein